MAGNAIDLRLHVDDRDDESDQEEALSLCDFPLGLDDDEDDQNPKNENENELGKGKLWPARSREGAAAAPEYFEFFSDHSSEMCVADDIIICGKLIPLEPPPLPPPREKKLTLSIQVPPAPRSFDEYRRRRNHRGGLGLGKRSESHSDLCSRRSSNCGADDNKSALLRNSRSLDYHRHQRRRCNVERNSSMESAGKSGGSPPKKGCFKSRWYGFVFGKDKFTPEMELRDIKSRQCRRIQSLTSSPQPEAEDGGKKFTCGGGSGKVSWGFLKALSCMEHTNVAVTASLCIPQA